MGMSESLPSRRTSADYVFDSLYEQIIALDLMPGTKMSEADVADQFGVSRQPVRDAFNRLGSLGLLLIQPQKATLVQKFSMAAITKARFMRLAIELEMSRDACKLWSEDFRSAFLDNIEAQSECIVTYDPRAFHFRDIEFHELIADVAQKPFARDIVRQNKAQVDRICRLSLKNEKEMQDLVEDHRKILELISTNRPDMLADLIRSHLARIEGTIATVRAKHAEYFAD